MLLSLILVAQQPKIIISELLYDTPLPNEGQNPHMHNGEFASIYNYGDVSVDISGWRLISDTRWRGFVTRANQQLNNS